MMVLPAAIEAEIRREGEAAWPDECCGVILGRLGELPGGGFRREAERIIPIANAREAEEQYHRFRIEAEDLLKAELAARREGREVLGFYHSHPDHPASPSDYDREHALPFYSYLILGVEKGRAAELTCWELTADRKEFRAEHLLPGTAGAGS